MEKRWYREIKDQQQHTPNAKPKWRMNSISFNAQQPVPENNGS